MTKIKNTSHNRTGLKSILKPKFMIEWVEILKAEGLKGFLKVKGWKVLIAFFLIYLVRDSLIYIIMPYFFAKGILGC